MLASLKDSKFYLLYITSHFFSIRNTFSTFTSLQLSYRGWTPQIGKGKEEKATDAHKHYHMTTLPRNLSRLCSFISTRRCGRLNFCEPQCLAGVDIHEVRTPPRKLTVSHPHAHIHPSAPVMLFPHRAPSPQT